MWGFVRSSRTLSVSSRSSTLPLRRVSAPRAPHFCPSPRLSHPSSSYFYSSSSASAAVESNNNNNNSHSRFTTKMSGTAQKIDGKVLSDKIRNDIKAHVAAKQQQNPEYKPSLVIIQGTPWSAIEFIYLSTPPTAFFLRLLIRFLLHSRKPDRFQYVIKLQLRSPPDFSPSLILTTSTPPPRPEQPHMCG